LGSLLGSVTGPERVYASTNQISFILRNRREKKSIAVVVVSRALVYKPMNSSADGDFKG